MNKGQDSHDNPELRKRAEEAVSGESNDIRELSEEEMKRAIHELRIHQIELEMQNEELRRSQLELESARDRYSDLYDFAPVGYFTVNDKGTIVEANLTCAAMLGVEARGWLIGKPFSRFITRDNQDAFYLHCKELVETKGARSCELILKREDAAEFPAQLESMVVQDAEGYFNRIRSAVSNIEERVRAKKALKKAHDDLERRVEERTAELLLAQDQLIRSERLAVSGQLAGTVAHEINSPLQAVGIMLSMMKERCKDDAGLMESIDILNGAFEGIRDTVKNLLDLNRPGKWEKEWTDINKVLKQTIDLVKCNIDRNKIKVNLDLSPELPGIHASPQQLNHLFLNLINNAMEAMTDVSNHHDGLKKQTTDGKINIITMVSEGNIVITVADTGPGIAEKDLHHVFDAFYTRKKKMGMGVGLAICHGFVEDHGGTIAAENSPEGGAVFTIKLPISSSQRST